ncbi:hypothetical protein PanWU01x14_247970, partial [Parasponia andersonii]
GRRGARVRFKERETLELSYAQHNRERKSLKKRESAMVEEAEEELRPLKRPMKS